MIKRLSHVCLGSTDLQKTIDFYCGLLNCKIVHEFRNQKNELYGIFLLVNDGTFLEFFNEQNPSQQRHSLFRHLCFEVENIHEWAHVIKAKGYEIDVSRGRTDKALQFWIADPDGNQVEFHEYDRESVQYQYANSTHGA